VTKVKIGKETKVVAVELMDLEKRKTEVIQEK
jgi:hypothetical protein